MTAVKVGHAVKVVKKMCGRSQHQMRYKNHCLVLESASPTKTTASAAARAHLSLLLHYRIHNAEAGCRYIS
ncbi:hypothetical protein Cob_v010065 [Colletotrichum orbiculare MAFF 240422]|uniref:Uncharacterized protein n=1 Tax=Colletotrichum orbiculare (strain 104-T / ATCC 96160 / CBS 514.97 / LARS 414 / MAFF 240422) TaxID=1213857 RepID=A0A484FGQ4_COLOR|nr:hypothetical protein Cob_v010065 [Colletotrichum orbiculare MAFF 240422]